MAGPTTTVQDVTGLRRLATGAGVGLAGALAGLVVPLAFLYLSLYAPGGFFVFNPTLVQALGLLVVAGSILLLLSLLLYRRGFAVLRQVDRRFTVASALCLLGTVGFLLLLVAALVLLGSSDTLVTCVQGRPTQALTCLRSSQPLGAYTAFAGFLLGWLGGLGIVLGVVIAGRRYARGALVGGGVLYALLLLVLVGPFAALLYAVPGIQYLVWAVPALMVLSPGLAFAGSYPALEERRPA